MGDIIANDGTVDIAFSAMRVGSEVGGLGKVPVAAAADTSSVAPHF